MSEVIPVEPPESEPPLMRDKLVGDLKMIFWGVIICILDFNIIIGGGGGGFKCDIINDLIGAILIVKGVSGVNQLARGTSSEGMMKFVVAMAWILLVESVMDFFVFDSPPPLQILMTAIGIAQAIAPVLLCSFVHQVVASAGLQRSAQSWHLTKVLFIALWATPLIAFSLIGLVAAMTGNSFRASSPEMGIAVVALLIMVLIPIIHYRVSISRLEHDQAFTTFSSHGFPVGPTNEPQMDTDEH